MRHVALALVSLLTLFVAYWLGASSTAPAVPPSSLAAGEDQSTELLARIAADVRALREKVDSASDLAAPSPVAARAAVELDSGRVEPSLARIEALLSNAAASVPAARAPVPTGRSVDAGGWRSIEDLARDVRATTSDERDSFQRRLRNEHALWRIDDVLARYGPPTSVFPSSDSIAIEYDVTTADVAGTGASTVRFKVSQDRVTWVDVSR